MHQQVKYILYICIWLFKRGLLLNELALSCKSSSLSVEPWCINTEHKDTTKYYNW